MALIAQLISAGAAGLGGMMGNRGGTPQPQWMTPPQTEMGQKKQELIDQLLSSVNGDGPYKDLFNVDEAGFQKSFVDPMTNMFNNQIAPQIQQNYIAGGQQRGSGIDDTMTRAGVNMQDMLGQQYAQYQQNAQGNKANALNSILGFQEPQAQLYSGSQDPMSGSGAFGSGVAGFASSPGFGNSFQDMLTKYMNQGSSGSKGFLPVPKGRMGESG